MKKTQEILFAVFGIVFALILVVAVIEGFFRVFPGLLPEEFDHIRYVTHDPDVGSKLKPDYEINLTIEDGIVYNVRTVGLGFGDVGFRDDGIDGEAYGVTLGDSFTFGEGLEMEDTWTELLEEKSGRDFVNMGVSGHGTEHELRFLKKYGVELNPKVIVVMFHDNDFENNHGYLTTSHQGIRNWLRENSITYEVVKVALGKMFGIGSKANYERENVVEEYNDGNIHIIFLKEYWFKKSQIGSEVEKIGEESTKNAFAEMKQIAAGLNATLLVATVPLKDTPHLDLIRDRIQNMDDYNVSYRIDRALEICKEVEVDCIDMTPVLREKGVKEQLYFVKDGHLNSRGNEVVADEIYNHLKLRGAV